jgi:hypothetical protein
MRPDFLKRYLMKLVRSNLRGFLELKGRPIRLSCNVRSQIFYSSPKSVVECPHP